MSRPTAAVPAVYATAIPSSSIAAEGITLPIPTCVKLARSMLFCTVVQSAKALAPAA